MAPHQVDLPNEELDWISIRRESDKVFSETSKEKMIRKIKENPFVPIGCFATVTALGFGLYNFRAGNREKSQMMMRARILAQGFTLVALVVGVMVVYKKD